MNDFTRNIKRHTSKNLKRAKSLALLTRRKLSDSILSIYDDSSTSNSEQVIKIERRSFEDLPWFEAPSREPPTLTRRAQTHADLPRLRNDLYNAAQEYALGLSLNNLNQNSNNNSTVISQSPTKKHGCYDLSGTKDLIIINVMKYTNGKPRTGSEKDVERLETAFGSRDFNIARKLTSGEVYYDQVKAALKSYVQSDAKPSFFAIAIMAHGDEEDFVRFSDGMPVSVNKILEPIFKSPKFLGIPKLILCQFCRGNSQAYTCHSLDSAELKKEKFANSLADTVYYFATAKGNPAMRSKDGSPFITSFCEVFQREPDLMTVSFEVNREVADQEFWTNGDAYRVVPVFNHSLRKRIVFPEK